MAKGASNAFITIMKQQLRLDPYLCVLSVPLINKTPCFKVLALIVQIGVKFVKIFKEL